MLNIYMGGLCAAIIYWFVGVYYMTHDTWIQKEVAAVVTDEDAWIVDLAVYLVMCIGFIIVTLWPIILLANIVLIVDYALRN
jgi:hypothetical protein